MARISMRDWREQEGLEDDDDFLARLQELNVDSVCPALCDEGCEVEPDGTCPHGGKAVLLAAGLV